ncbi:hypothetical protein SAY86_027054 [Trapa natans]|uniref:Uncharacterized protein n=1 Tax=Trapa natans TaxID=22666 RepID=A0AAN7QIN6_TRANT|nr:hypothetical protein SAY86_027054 [Trapa natans]
MRCSVSSHKVASILQRKNYHKMLLLRNYVHHDLRFRRISCKKDLCCSHEKCLCQKKSLSPHSGTSSLLHDVYCQELILLLLYTGLFGTLCWVIKRACFVTSMRIMRHIIVADPDLSCSS